MEMVLSICIEANKKRIENAISKREQERAVMEKVN